MKKGYLIEYGYGEYEDYRTEIVKCFLDKKKAETYKDKWNNIYNKWYEYYQNRRRSVYEVGETEESDYFEDKWWDRLFSFEYYGTCWIKEIEIIEDEKRDNKISIFNR